MAESLLRRKSQARTTSIKETRECMLGRRREMLKLRHSTPTLIWAMSAGGMIVAAIPQDRNLL
jgi:hypothetical protein